jgi:hypothetical protein
LAIGAGDATAGEAEVGLGNTGGIAGGGVPVDVEGRALVRAEHADELRLFDLVEDALIGARAEADEAGELGFADVGRGVGRVRLGQRSPHLDIPVAIDIDAVEQRAECALLEADLGVALGDFEGQHESDVAPAHHRAGR